MQSVAFFNIPINKLIINDKLSEKQKHKQRLQRITRH
jgi:hypothetical protein